MLLPLSFLFLYKFSRSKHHQWAKLVYTILILSTFIATIFGQKVSVAREIIQYNREKDSFKQLVEQIEESPCYGTPGCYWSAPITQQNEFSDREPFFVIASREHGILMIAELSRPRTYFTYLPHLTEIIDSYIRGYYVDCFHKLGQHWFLCSISLN